MRPIQNQPDSESPDRSWLLMLCTVYVLLGGICMIHASSRGIAWLIWGVSATRSEIISIVLGPIGLLLLVLQPLAVFGRKHGAARDQIVLLAKTGRLADLLSAALLLGFNAMNLLTIWEMGKWRRGLTGPRKETPDACIRPCYRHWRIPGHAARCR